MITIAAAHYKGGSGKSTAVVQLAVAAVGRGLRTVIVDTDVQGSATKWSRVSDRARHRRALAHADHRLSAAGIGHRRNQTLPA
jgi:cellulose biosynthesis protein BcsQ